MDNFNDKDPPRTPDTCLLKKELLKRSAEMVPQVNAPVKTAACISQSSLKIWVKWEAVYSFFPNVTKCTVFIG